MEVYIIYMTTYVCKQRVVASLLIELLSKMRKMRTITPPDATYISKRKLIVEEFFEVAIVFEKIPFFFFKRCFLFLKKKTFYQDFFFFKNFFLMSLFYF